MFKVKDMKNEIKMKMNLIPAWKISIIHFSLNFNMHHIVRMRYDMLSYVRYIFHLLSKIYLLHILHISFRYINFTHTYIYTNGVMTF